MIAAVQTYAEFRPSQFDAKGLGCEDRQNWLVCPCSRTRDSGVMTRANFQATLEILGGESETVEVHRFGHWGPGWFEIVLVHPSRAEDMESVTPSDYPVLCDKTLSSMEREDELEAWPAYGCDEFRTALADMFELSDTAKDYPTATELYGIFAQYDVGVEHSDEGPDFGCERTVASMVRLTDTEDGGARDTLAKWFREIRSERRQG